MLPSNVDPRRPDKIHRFKSKVTATAANNSRESTPNAKANDTNSVTNGSQVEDLTPDYMNILGQHATTANSADAADKHAESIAGPDTDHPMQLPAEDGRPAGADDPEATAATTNATNVIPTSPQYGVAIISNAINPTDVIGGERVSPAVEATADSTAKPQQQQPPQQQPPDDIKDLQSTPSRNDRFKVVKIASLEPFKRGRWKCMDYVDEAPPPSSQQSKVTQSTGSIQVAGGVYFQTQSLPQQQIQQMLLQGGFPNGTQFVPAQMVPAQGQYFYPQVTTIQTQTLPQQTLQGGVPTAQFIGATQPYFPAGMMPNAAGFALPQSYPNIQYVPANLLQGQGTGGGGGGAFVPTSQAVQLPASFQQSQTYSGQASVSQQQQQQQQQPATVTQPLVNGHAYPTQQSDQVTSSSLPTQAAKTVILTSGTQQPQQQQQPSSQTQLGQLAAMPQGQVQQQANNTQSQSVPVIQQIQQIQQNQQFQQQQQQNFQQLNIQQQKQMMQGPGGLIQVPQVVSVPSQSFDHSLASNVYTNPQFAMSVNSLSVLENNDNSTDNVGEAGTTASESTGESSDDPAKTNPVVNAIDNKIEQAMDLVKSHLMYTVREEVEVLKEKIAELMERIQQLETENNYLRSQIPKGQQGATPGTTVVPPPVNPTPVSNAAAPAPVNPASINTPTVNAAPPIGGVATGAADIASQQ